MAPPIVAPMPQALDLAGSYTFVFDAVDSATGVSLGTVVVSDAALFGEAFGTITADDFTFGPFVLVAGPGA